MKVTKVTKLGRELPVREPKAPSASKSRRRLGAAGMPRLPTRPLANRPQKRSFRGPGRG